MHTIKQRMAAGEAFYQIILTNAQTILRSELDQDISALTHRITEHEDHLKRYGQDPVTRLTEAAASYARYSHNKDPKKGKLPAYIQKELEKDPPKTIGLDGVRQKFKLQRRGGKDTKRDHSRALSINRLIRCVEDAITYYDDHLNETNELARLEYRKDRLTSYRDTDRLISASARALSGIPYDLLRINPETPLEQYTATQLDSLGFAIKRYIDNGYASRLLGNDQFETEVIDALDQLKRDIARLRKDIPLRTQQLDLFRDQQ